MDHKVEEMTLGTLMFYCKLWEIDARIHLNDIIGEDSKYFLSVNDAAEKFNVGPAVCNAWVETGMLKAFKVGNAYKIPRDEEPNKNMFSVIS